MSARPEPVLLASYDSRHEAEMALGFLEDSSLTAAILSDDAGSMKPELAFQGRVRLWVPGDEAEEARELLSDAGLLHDVVPPVWSASAPSATGPSMTRDLAAMALLFGGVALLLLDLFFRLTGPSHAGVTVGAGMFVLGLFLTFRSIAESRATRRRQSPAE